jgi:hypothetical protein
MTDHELYDVALSFAGEERDYARTVADELRTKGIAVFFDEYEQVDMWGKDLYEHLHDVYSSKAHYCVIFVSESYARKNWTTHERRSAQERALRENRQYILPARFDSTELPGLSSTVGYIDLRQLSPREFANVILDKLGRSGEAPQSEARRGFRVPKIQATSFDPYRETEGFIEFLATELGNRAYTLERANAQLSIHSRGERKCFRVLRGETVIFSLDVWMGGISGDKGLSLYAVEGEIRHPSSSISAWANIEWDQDEEQLVIRLHDMSLLGFMPVGEKTFAFKDFADQIWGRIVDMVERAS